MRILGVVVALLLVAAVAYAAGTVATKVTTVTGTVKAVDVAKCTLTVTSEKTDTTFTVTKETKVTVADAAKTLADVKVGAKVVVTVGEKNVAKTVSVAK